MVGAPFLSLPIGQEEQASFSIGIIADPHKDIVPDADQRMEEFLKACETHTPDFVIQMGDFCHPLPQNKGFLSLFNSFKGPTYHLLGNHDMDEASKEETLDFWESEKAYYSFDHKGIHFVVLDPNFLFTEKKFVPYEKANFYVDGSLRTFIPPEQLEWLSEDLQNTDFPTLVFSHQSLAHDIWGIKNRLSVQKILEDENKRAGKQKIIACFNGHNHIDFHRQVNGISYIDINSMAYFWLGEAFENRSRFSANLYQKHPSMAYVAPYDEALFTFLDFDFSTGNMYLHPKSSSWVAPSPSELGHRSFYGSIPSPTISSQTLSFSL